MKNWQPGIVIIGAGNVAFHLGQKLFDRGINVIQVFSRKIKKARRLAELLDAQPIDKISLVSKQADLYILAVSDDAIEDVAKQLSGLDFKSQLVVHTSGATPGSLLKEYFPNWGVFYPLQSFFQRACSRFQYHSHLHLVF